MSETTKQLEAGVELDALIAEKVMGWAVVRVADGANNIDDMIESVTEYTAAFVVFPEGFGERVARGSFEGAAFRPSEFIDDAWMVVEKLRPELWVRVLAGREFQDDDLPKYDCEIGRYGSSESLWRAMAFSSPMAICLAALEAMT